MVLTPIPQEIVKEAKGLYLGDILGQQLYGHENAEVRDEIWREFAKTHPNYSREILGLRCAVKAALVTRTQYVPQAITAISLGILELEVKDANERVATREFLVNLLIERVLLRPGYINYDLDIPKECSELVSKIGKVTSLEDAVRKALSVVPGADYL